MTKLNKMLVSILAAVVVAVSLVVPNAYADTGKDLGEGIFKNVTVKLDGTELSLDDTNEVEYDDKSQLQITFDWELPDNDENFELKAGDWAKIKIPDVLKYSKDITGNLLDDGVPVGTFTVTEDGYLEVVFNDELEDKDNRDGTVGFLLYFKLLGFEDDVYQRLEFGAPFNKTFNLKVEPGGTLNHVSKTGNPNSTINTEYIDWSIDVNTKLESLNNGVLEDAIPEGLSLVSGSVEIYELYVGLNGKLTQSDNPIILPNSLEENVLRVEFGETDRAYRVIYRTNVDEFKESFTNNAILKDNETEIGEANDTVDNLTRGSRIEKTGKRTSKNSNYVEWIIDINKSVESLKNVKVLDAIPDGFKEELKSLTIHKLNEVNGQWVEGENVTTSIVGENKSFPIDFDDIDSAYRIKVSMEIDYEYFKEYRQDFVFENVAELEVDGNVVDTDDAEVEFKRETLLAKSGKETTSYGDSIISWTINVNKAKHIIEGAKITDTIGEGLELDVSTVKVFDVKANKYLENADVQNMLTQNGNEFVVDFGKIDSEYRIEYDTKIVALLPEGDSAYKNNVDLTGEEGLGGTGIGDDDTTKETLVKPSINNTYDKSTEYYEILNEVLYDGINYEEKTMSWKLTIDAIKEEITELTISDSFDPEKTMLLIKDTLQVFKGNDKLEIDKDYTLTNNGVDGFDLEFTNDHKPLERAKYEVYYKTSFDVNTVLGESGEVNSGTEYKNIATFTGKTVGVNGIKDINTQKFDSYWVHQEYRDQGVKYGEIDRETRIITWRIYTNATSRDLTGDPFVIEDNLTQGNQKIKKDVKVYKYTLKKDGFPDDDNVVEIPPTDYILHYGDSEKDFTVTFSSGVDFPVMVEFSSKVEGTSESEYKNIAKVTDKTSDVPKEYPETVEYDDHDKFITKEVLNSDGDRVYTDDELEWVVSLNESLSFITNAEFKDHMSSGLVLLKDSIKVYTGDRTPGNLKVINEEDILIIHNEDGSTDLKIILGDIVEDRIFVEYTTWVTATTGQINNNASLFGDGEEIEKSGDKIFDATQSSWGSGGGTARRGQFTINKIDSETKKHITAPAKFELYYFINGEEVIFGEEATATVDGKLSFENLPFRTYFLREVEAPKGYQSLDDDVEIVVNKDHKDFELNVENVELFNYAIGDYTWIDANKDGIQDENESVLPGVIVELYDGDGTKIADTTTDENGFYIFDELPSGEYQVRFILTEEQAEIYEFTKLENGSHDNDSNADPVAGDNYGFTKKFILDETNESLTKDYENQEFEATRGIDPTWDAGAVLREKISISGSKTWDDADNQDGKRPTSIKVTLYIDGIEDETLTVESEDWSWTFDNLYKKNAGATTDIVYTIMEEKVDGYSTDIDGYNITNSYTPGKTSVQVTKAWDDKDNIHGLRPNDVTVRLLANDVDTGKTLILSAENNWVGSFIDLDEYAAGQLIDYTVEEVSIDEYNSVVRGSHESGYVVTNEQKTYAIGDYTWIDNNKDGIQDEDEPVLAGVIVELYDGDGNKISETTTDENGYYIFDELPSGEYQVKFILTEEQAEIYEFTKLENGSHDNDSNADPVAGENYGFTKKFTLDDENASLSKTYENQEFLATEGIDPTWDAGVIVRERISISGSKTWDDADNQDGKRPTSIKVTLYKDGVEHDNITVTSDNWSWTFNNLYKRNAGATTDIVYTIMEEKVDGYSTEIDGYNITNSYTPGKTSVQVTKAWNDKDNKHDSRPENIVVKLLADGKDTGQTLVLSKDNNWVGSFVDLDEYVSGKLISYTVEEISVKDYNSTVNGSHEMGYVITNEQKTYAIGDYTWIDRNKDGIQDEEEPVLPGVIVELYDDKGNIIAETTTDENGRYIFDELPAGNYKVKFTLTEKQAARYEFTKRNAGNNSAKDSDVDPISGWTIEFTLGDENLSLTKEYDDQLYNATEGIDPTWDAGVVEKLIEVTVEKIWIHSDRETQTIGVQLYRNGEAFGDVVRLEKGTNTYTWKDLDLTDLSGNEYVYTVDEVEVPLGYHKEVYGFTIINTFDQGLLDALLPKPEEKPKDKLPLTGAVSLASIATGTLLASGLFFALSKKRKED